MSAESGKFLDDFKLKLKNLAWTQLFGLFPCIREQSVVEFWSSFVFVKFANRICSDWKQPFSDKSKKILTYTMFAIYEMPFSMLYLIYMQSIFWPIVRNSTFRCRIRKKLQKMRQEYELLTSYSIWSSVKKVKRFFLKVCKVMQ